MLVFSFLLIIILLIILLITQSTVKLEIKYQKNNYKIIIYLYLLGKIRYFKMSFYQPRIEKITKKILEKAIEKEENKLKKINIYNLEKVYINNKKSIKKFIKKMELEYLDLDLKIGTEFILLTSMIVVTLSTLFPLFINKFITKYNTQKYNYKFTPIYNKNEINLNFNCIINVKMVHIISVICHILLKKGVIKNVRTSNTRFNDNCYE